MKLCITTLLLVCIATNSFSQLTDNQIKEIINTSSEEKLVAENSRLLIDGFLVQAEMITDKLLTLQSESPNYNYRKGYILIESNKDYEAAIPFLLKAVTQTNSNYDAFSAKKQDAPIDAFFYLATCFQTIQDFTKATENFNKFIEKSNPKSRLLPLANLKLKQCEQAKKLISQPVNIELKNVGNNVNSIYGDYSPVISLDGSSLYFTSRRPWGNGKTDSIRDPYTNEYKEDVFVSFMNNDSTWADATRLNFNLPERNEATVSVSSDERRIYLFKDSTGNGDLYFTDFYAQKFQDISVLSIDGLNTENWESHFFLTQDAKNIYFTSDRPGGFGGLDIYVCNSIGESSWSAPINLGAKINSEFDEDAPFVSFDHKTLFYSSNGEKSMGGFDILFSDLSTDNTWSESQNLGYPLNSTSDDIFYTTTIDGSRGYLSSTRKGGIGANDIYEIKSEYFGAKSIAVLNGYIHTTDNSPLPDDLAIAMKLQCIDCEDSKSIKTIFPRLRDGVFISNLQPCKTYELTYVNATDKLNMYQDKFTTQCTNDSQEIYRDILLDVKNKKVIPVKHFAVDGAIADKTTNKGIDKVKIEVLDLSTKNIIETKFTKSDGSFNLAFLNKKPIENPLNYEIKISKENYLTQVVNIIQNKKDDLNIHLSLTLQKFEIGSDLASLFNVKPIYFGFDKSNLRSESEIELDKIVKILNDNPTLEIECGSYTDCRGSSEYNLSLSERRAKISSDYIKQRITNPSRIQAKGFGESKLVNSCNCEGIVKYNCSNKDHQLNRRTEFKITKI
jgi:outer membrane protein OmpA-like peptidoglycan-associated protein/tetratricopeptide (TPR) repeat protein